MKRNSFQMLILIIEFILYLVFYNGRGFLHIKLTLKKNKRLHLLGQQSKFNALAPYSKAYYTANKNVVVDDAEYRLYVISGMHQKSSDSHIKATFPIKNQTKLQHGTSQNEPRKCVLREEIIVFECLCKNQEVF